MSIYQRKISTEKWWGGHFERLFGLTKQAFFKSLGRTILRWGELEEVMPDFEIKMNSRPPNYIE